ncbi:MAG: hypothetical protein ACOCYP_08385 [Planctomycetota bacterium]
MPYQIVLRECQPDSLEQVAQAISLAFGVKDSTAVTVVQSAPIILLADLTEQEAAALQLTLRCLELSGGIVEYTNVESGEELPKIDWPKRPKIFKRSIGSYPAEYAFDLPAGNGRVRLVDLLVARLNGTSTPITDSHSAGDSGGYKPQNVSGGGSRREFQGSDLGEITPFSNPILPPANASDSGGADVQPGTAGIDAAQVGSRMDELFGNGDDTETGNVVPSTNDITKIIDQLLPEDELANASGASPTAGGGGTATATGGGRFSVFLNKINDENRRKKVVPLLMDMINIEAGEAEGLAKKMIIPVLKNVSKDEAEAAKHRFAEIGVLARIRS